MNSPRGAAASLAKRIVNQSPAPDFLTPSPAAGSANQKRARETAFTDTSTPALPSAAKATSKWIVGKLYTLQDNNIATWSRLVIFIDLYCIV